MLIKVAFEQSNQRIDVTFSDSGQRLEARFGQSEQRIPVKFDGLQIVSEPQDIEYYKGKYDVTPKVESQIVETAKKYLVEDMKVKAIPYYDVSNPSGGNTIYIGNEV